MPEEEPWAKYDILDPAICLLNGTAWAGFFYLRNTLILPAAGSGWQLELLGLNATWKFIAVPSGQPRGGYPQRTGAILQAGLLGVDWPKCYLTS